MSYRVLDVPFDYRYTCWFCGEPSATLVDCSDEYGAGSPIQVPCCDECEPWAKNSKALGLEAIRETVKHQLTVFHRQELQIGLRWTEQELANSEFEDVALAGFKQSGWAMYQIAKDRINYTGWPLSVDGVPLTPLSQVYQIEYQGIRYASLSEAIEQLCTALEMNEDRLYSAVDVFGRARFSDAVAYARSNQSLTDKEWQDSLTTYLSVDAQPENRRVEQRTIQVDDVQGLIVERIYVDPIAIAWALNNGIENLSMLSASEDKFWADFEYESERAAFTYFNGLQVYLEKREQDTFWASMEDPNKTLFR